MTLLRIVLAAGLLLAGCKAQPWEARRVTPQEVHARMAQGEPVLMVDVRSPRSFEQEHIAGAVNFANGRLEAEAPNLPHDRWMVLYCT